MKYTKEERLDIGRRIYDGEITRYQAAEEYDIGEQTARNYMRMYRYANLDLTEMITSPISRPRAVYCLACFPSNR